LAPHEKFHCSKLAIFAWGVRFLPGLDNILPVYYIELRKGKEALTNHFFGARMLCYAVRADLPAVLGR
jgi:hypothetical protein